MHAPGCGVSAPCLLSLRAGQDGADADPLPSLPPRAPMWPVHPSPRVLVGPRSNVQIGNQWTFCDFATQKPTLPSCTCAARWLNSEGYCGRSAKRNRGCPSLEELQECDPKYNGTTWCLTNEAECLEQEDWAGSEGQVGKGWAYCDVQTQTAELPVCECEDTWTPGQEDCDDDVDVSKLSFSTCPTHDQLKKCTKGRASTDQSWCTTKQARCRHQSVGSPGVESMVRQHTGTPKCVRCAVCGVWCACSECMHERVRACSKPLPAANLVGVPWLTFRCKQVNESWSYCNPPTANKKAEAVWPSCECRKEWDHNSDACADEPFRMQGCPTIGNLVHCEYSPTQSWCDTTYESCMEQSYEADGAGWVYCDAHKQKPELPTCECMESWTSTEGDCSDRPTDFRGCPTEAEIGVCEGTKPWCYTKDNYCKEQNDHDENTDEGWVYCDPLTQRPIHGPVAGTHPLLLPCVCVCVCLCVASTYCGVLAGPTRLASLNASIQLYTAWIAG